MLDCRQTPNGGEYTWVGTGGYWHSGTLLQTGTHESCTGGEQQDSAWWEEYPSVPNRSRTFAHFAVSAGQHVVATVARLTDGRWRTTVDDETSGRSAVMVTGEGWGVSPIGAPRFALEGVTRNLVYPGALTAEWVVEDFRLNGIPVPLADYGALRFRGLRTSVAGWRLDRSEAVGMVRNGTTLAAPSPPEGDGFTDRYLGPLAASGRRRPAPSARHGHGRVGYGPVIQTSAP